jgi:hypothetical protein
MKLLIYFLYKIYIENMSCQYIYKNTSFKLKGTVCGRKLKSADSYYCWQYKDKQAQQKESKKPEFIQLQNTIPPKINKKKKFSSSSSSSSD